LLHPDSDFVEDDCNGNSKSEGGLFNHTVWKEDQLEKGKDTPVGYNPHGFMPFMAWGPVSCTYAVPYVQLKQLHQNGNDKGGSRKEIKKNLAKSKEAEHDLFELGIGDVHCGLAGNIGAVFRTSSFDGVFETVKYNLMFVLQVNGCIQFKATVTT